MISDFKKRKLIDTGFFRIFLLDIGHIGFSRNIGRLISNQSTSDAKVSQKEMLTRAETLD